MTEILQDQDVVDARTGVEPDDSVTSGTRWPACGLAKCVHVLRGHATKLRARFDGSAWELVRVALTIKLRHWGERIGMPDWTQRLRRETKDVRSAFGRSALLPVVVVLALIALVYNSGQLRSLAIALTAPLGTDAALHDGGFGASYPDLLLWMLSCGVLA